MADIKVKATVMNNKCECPVIFHQKVSKRTIVDEIEECKVRTAKYDPTPKSMQKKESGIEFLEVGRKEDICIDEDIIDDSLLAITIAELSSVYDSHMESIESTKDNEGLSDYDRGYDDGYKSGLGHAIQELKKYASMDIKEYGIF